jgi:putative oxidoreductase
MIGEVGGGIALVLGIMPRYVALLLIPLMIGTIVVVHGKNGWMFNNKDGRMGIPGVLGCRTTRTVSVGRRRMGAVALSKLGVMLRYGRCGNMRCSKWSCRSR